MDFIKGLTVVFAMLVPLAVFCLLFWNVAKDRKTDWKLATCLSGLAVATSLVFLLASERVTFLRYGDAVLHVKQKSEETRELTEQNKRLAVMTVKAIKSGLWRWRAAHLYRDPSLPRTISGERCQRLPSPPVSWWMRASVLLRQTREPNRSIIVLTQDTKDRSQKTEREMSARLSLNVTRKSLVVNARTEKEAS
jgi:hypothetical protein